MSMFALPILAYSTFESIAYHMLILEMIVHLMTAFERLPATFASPIRRIHVHLVQATERNETIDCR